MTQKKQCLCPVQQAGFRQKQIRHSVHLIAFSFPTAQRLFVNNYIETYPET